MYTHSDMVQICMALLFFGGVPLSFIVGCLFYNFGKWDMQHEAVKTGVAEYKADKYGASVFVWKKPRCEDMPS